MNDRGFRTRNTKRLPTSGGQDIAGPRRFTNASVRGILHNAFYAGSVKHGKRRLPGEHEPIVGAELFESVQLMLSKNSGRSATIGRRKTRTYLLKGLARCADCGLNLWAQTYKNGRAYYREQRATRSHGECRASGGSAPCDLVDTRIGEIVSSISLPADWRERLVEKIKRRDEVTKIIADRERVKDRLRRLSIAFVDGYFDESEYRRQKNALTTQLEALVIPEIDVATEAGRLLEDLPKLWSGAVLDERHRLLRSAIDAVYIRFGSVPEIVKIQPKAGIEDLISIGPVLAS